MNIVPEELKPYVDSFRGEGKEPSIKDLLQLSIHDDICINLLPKRLKNLFNEYVYAKEEELELCSSSLVHPDDKESSRQSSRQAFSAFSDEMHKCLGINKEQQTKRRPLDFSEGENQNIVSEEKGKYRKL